MDLFTKKLEYNFFRTTLKRGILISILMYIIFFVYYLFISIKQFYPLLIAFAVYISFLGWFYWLFLKEKYNLSRLLFLYFSTLFFAFTSFILLGVETNNHYYLLIFSVLALWMNHKESIISALLFFIITLFLFTAAEFSFFPDIAIIDYPENLVKSEAIQNVVFSFVIVFYVSYLFNKASINKEEQLAQKARELRDLNSRLEESQHEVEQQRKALLELNTELEKYIAQISEKNKELNTTNKTKDKLFNIVSHDLKSPLASFVGLTELLNQFVEIKENDNISTIVKALNSSANGLQKLVLGLLDWSRIQTGSISPVKKPFQLLKAINSNEELYEQNLKEKSIVLEVECSSKIYINADFSMFETVVRNLLNNAVKFTYPNGIIRIIAFKSDKEITLSISDNGVGMSQEKIHNLSNFHEAISTTGTNDEKGSGLGLLVCYEFLKLNNFSLDVKSQEGKGSTFTIHIPL